MKLVSGSYRYAVALGLVLSGLAVVAEQSASLQPAGAATNPCGPSPASSWDDQMFGHTVENWEGVSANIVDVEGAFCTTDSGDESTVTTQVIEQTGGGVTVPVTFGAYVQSGFYRANVSHYEFIWETDTSSGIISSATGSSLSYGETHHYWSKFTASPNIITPYVDSDGPLPGLNVSDIQSGFTKLNAVVDGNLSYLTSDQPGSSSSPTKIDQLEFQVNHRDPESSGKADQFISDMNDYGGLSYYNDSGIRYTTNCNYQHRWGYTQINWTTNDAAIYAATTGNGHC
jgi:hypothetical protein